MTRSHGCGGPGSDLEQFTGGGENHLDVEVYGAISGGENHPDVEVHGVISGGENHPDVEVYGAISGGENHPDVEVHGAISGGENHPDVEVYGAISGGENHPDVEVYGGISGGENHLDVEVHGAISGGENHPDVGRETLQEQFTKEGVGIGRCTKLVPKELLHASEEQLCWLAVAELFSTDEMLQLTLFGGCSAFDELGLERIIGALGWRLE